MIIRFEDFTTDLINADHEVTQWIATRLTLRIGKDKAITNEKMCKSCKDHGYKITGPKMRKVLHFLRVNGIVKRLVSNSNGYYVADSITDIVEYILSLKQRISSITEVRDAMIGDAEEMRNGQRTPNLFD